MATLLIAASSASADVLGFHGNFTQDDNVQLFYYHVSNLSPVTISTTSFASGGFSPILTLFDSTGLFQTESVGYSSGDGEASIDLWPSLADELYIVALTQWDNQAVASQTFGNLSEGFLRDGQGNFTAEPPFNPSIPGGSFLLPGPEQRTSFWSVNFSSADPTLEVTAVPEPSTITLSLAGGVLLAGWLATKRRRNRPSN